MIDIKIIILNIKKKDLFIFRKKEKKINMKYLIVFLSNLRFNFILSNNNCSIIILLFYYIFLSKIKTIIITFYYKSINDKKKY